MPTRIPDVEIAIQDVDGLGVALAVGADRVELCSALGVGGLTPSIGIIESTVETAAAAGKPGFVQVLVRPRPGGFVYSSAEIDTTVRDIRAARHAGVGGVVVGALTADNRVDVAATRAFIDAAEGITVTFHRAIDAGGDPMAALDALIELGVDRVLTSGGYERSLDGRDVLAALATRSAGRLQIMAGGGVSVESIVALRAAGVDAVHLSAKRAVSTAGPTGPGGGLAFFDVTDADVAAAAVAAARSTLEP
ncbi:copper homeostasis protein CutC [Glaciibacter psychrotolerans]|uniref:PF03932 family protein CutC n=1 Tax=Glaciibacter psychrotolerans TaxID=670054 RepID=A0A7Z0EDC6_9MICO|nr:copper homeostasis protein CutC [Leifsonia psychrotolerans]NYJ19569.1 copper homeostasis protein [Leifsonia psychrotolerans]